MDHSQGRITILNCIHDDTHRKKIVNLIHGLILVYHLFINAEEMLHTAIDFCLNIGVLHMLGDFFYNLCHKLFPLSLSLVDLLH